MVYNIKYQIIDNLDGSKTDDGYVLEMEKLKNIRAS